VQRARHHRADDHRADVGLGEPSSASTGGARPHIRPPSAAVGRDPPARADRAVLDEGEDEIGVAGVDGEQHGMS
jgi:hypothetical protein